MAQIIISLESFEWITFRDIGGSPGSSSLGWTFLQDFQFLLLSSFFALSRVSAVRLLNANFMSIIFWFLWKHCRLQYPACMKTLPFTSVWWNNCLPFSIQPAWLHERNAALCDMIRSREDVGNVHFVLRKCDWQVVYVLVFCYYGKQSPCSFHFSHWVPNHSLHAKICFLWSIQWRAAIVSFIKTKEAFNSSYSLPLLLSSTSFPRHFIYQFTTSPLKSYLMIKSNNSSCSWRSELPRCQKCCFEEGMVYKLACTPIETCFLATGEPMWLMPSK